MALKPLTNTGNPYGCFDGYDTEYLLVKGGEVGTLRNAAVHGADKAAKDADGSDGYVGTTAPTQYRPAITTTLASGARPLFLLDDGTSGYGTLFGQVVGGIAGQVTAGSQLGPHTATGSGKLTAWVNPGLYAVTLDAVDTTAATGLTSTNATLAIGDPLYATSAGLLTPNSGASFETGPAPVLARFVEFQTSQSLVTTPVQLVSALNSPTGSGEQLLTMSLCVIHWDPPNS